MEKSISATQLARRLSSRNITESEDWFFDNLIANSTDLFLTTKNSMMSGYWPFMERYYSPLNACFSLEANGRIIASQKYWMLRDGELPLAWFFKTVSPSSFGGTLLVHEDLGALIPKAWRGKTKLYRHVSKRVFGRNNPPKSILFGAPVNAAVTPLETVERTIQQLVDTFGESKLRKMNTSFFFPIRQYNLLGHDDSGFEFKVLQRVAKYFGNDLEFNRWAYLENASTFEGTAYVEFNSGCLFKDSYVQQMMLSKGAGLIVPSSGRARYVDKEGSRDYVPLSDYHGVEILPAEGVGSFRESSTEVKKMYVRLAKLMSRNADPYVNPWPTWFEKWERTWIRSSSDSTES